MKLLVWCLAVLPYFGFAREVGMAFMVCDDGGKPLAGVKIDVYSRLKPPAAYARSPISRTSCQTDRDGRARITFETWEGLVDCYFEQAGFYPEARRQVRFASHFDKTRGETAIDEREMSVTVRMRRVRNPIPMIRGSLGKGIRRFPADRGAFGYDLKENDWVRPYGRGTVADFHVVRDWVSDVNGVSCRSALEFRTPGGGAYIAKRHDSTAFPFDYQADTNRVFQTRFESSFAYDRRTQEVHHEAILGEDEYLVIRTRAQVDAEGRVVAANYLLLGGPIDLGRHFGLGVWYFNPNHNDTNLEYQREKGE